MTTRHDPLLDRQLAAGWVRADSRLHGYFGDFLGTEDKARVDETAAEIDGPWESLRISLDGFPISFRAQLDGQLVATITAVSATVHDEGPLPVPSDRDVPLALGRRHGGVRFIAEGSRLLPSGRRRYLRVTLPDRAWTYGRSETQTSTGTLLGAVLGSALAPTELRRGPDPATGTPVISLAGCREDDDAPPSRTTGRRPRKEIRNFTKLSWVDGTTVGEVVLALLLHIGTNQNRLMPLWWRAAMSVET